jgi:hypothetical protein
MVDTVDGDTLKISRWQIRRYDRVYGAQIYDDGYNPAADPLDHLVSEGDLTQYLMKSGLEEGLKYGWRVKYQDSRGVSSQGWSQELSLKIGTSQTRNFTILSGDNPNDFPMISFTQWPDDPSGEKVFGPAINNSYDVKYYTIAAYDPMKGEYVEYDQITVEPGKAFWFFTRKDVVLPLNGIPVSKKHEMEVNLIFNKASGNGWNMIAPPNDGSVDWNEVEVLQYDADGKIVNGPTPIRSLPDDNGFIDKKLWTWKGDGKNTDYDLTTEMKPNNGYWVKVKAENIYLRFPVPGAVKTAGRTGSSVRWISSHLLPSIKAAHADDDDKPPLPPGVQRRSSSGEPSSGGGGCFILTSTGN